jgi:hypothetical protein
MSVYKSIQMVAFCLSLWKDAWVLKCSVIVGRSLVTFNKPKALLVEDNLELLGSYSRGAARIGYEVLGARCVDEAIDIARVQIIDAIIIGTTLPITNEALVASDKLIVEREEILVRLLGEGVNEPSKAEQVNIGKELERIDTIIDGLIVLDGAARMIELMRGNQNFPFGRVLVIGRGLFDNDASKKLYGLDRIQDVCQCAALPDATERRPIIAKLSEWYKEIEGQRSRV